MRIIIMIADNQQGIFFSIDILRGCIWLKNTPYRDRKLNITAVRLTLILIWPQRS